MNNLHQVRSKPKYLKIRYLPFYNYGIVLEPRWPQYVINEQIIKRTDNTMIKRRKGQTTQWSKEEKDRQHNDQKKKRTDNTVIKRRKGQTTQWSKEEKDRQHYDQKKKRTDNTVIKRRKGQTTQWSKEEKDRQHNDQKKKRTDNTMIKRRKGQTTQWSIKHTQKDKYWASRAPIKGGDELSCPGRVSSFCSTSGTRCDTLAVISHEWGKKEWILIRTTGKYPWLFVTQIYQVTAATAKLLNWLHQLYRLKQGTIRCQNMTFITQQTQWQHIYPK